MKFISTNGSHAAGAKKSVSLIVALVLILVFAIGGTVAYIATHTDPVINKFTPTTSSITVEEKVSVDQKTEITVKNTSLDVPVYVRVALVANVIDGDKVTGSAAVPGFTLGDGWEKIGEYYYYKTPVDPKASTGNLLETPMTLEENMQVVVIADAIQANPKQAVIDAWGADVAAKLS